ncbi:MAG: hypothetical protein N3C57_06895 [Aquificaceae bacterium]|nr:hypothetical protein [Aquificaceae bacterium]
MWLGSARKFLVLFSDAFKAPVSLYKECWLTYPVYIKAGYPPEILELENANRL